MTDPGIFDLASPLLGSVDDLLGRWLAPVWRIAFFALLGSSLSMAIYRRFSRQAELALLERRTRAVQAELRAAGTDGRRLARLVRHNLALSGRRLNLSFWPALLASLPLLFLLAFSANRFELAAPVPGMRLYVTPEPAPSAPLAFDWQGVNAAWDARRAAWTFYYPPPGSAAVLSLDGDLQFRLPARPAADVVHKRRWWNRLFANPAGYLDDAAAVEALRLSLPTQVIIDWGPGWMRGWLFALLLFLVVFSLLIKRLWRIH